jgi:hypothetical protein
MTNEFPITEPMVVTDTFVTASLPILLMGDNMRVTLVSRERSLYDGTMQDAVVSKLVGSRADLLTIAATILRACEGEAALSAAPAVASFRRH